MAYKQATRQYARNMADTKPTITEPNRLIVKAELRNYNLGTLETEKANNQTLSEANLIKSGGPNPILKRRLFFDVYVVSPGWGSWVSVTLIFTDNVEVSVDEIKMTQADQHITGTITYLPELEGKIINFYVRINKYDALDTNNLYIDADEVPVYSSSSTVVIPLKNTKYNPGSGIVIPGEAPI